EGLAFVLHRLCERLAARLAVRGRGATALDLTCRLADGGTHVHRRGGFAPLAEPRTPRRLLLARPAGLTLPAPGVGPPPEAAVAGPRPLHVTGAALVRRRLVPPLSAGVELRDGRPATVAAPGIRGRVLAAAGPWRTAGEWWAGTAWAREEWDVALPDGAVYR